MAKYLRDIVLSFDQKIDQQFGFKLETNFLEILYLNSLPKIWTGGIAKVIITACEEISKTWVTSVKPGDVWINEVIGKIEWISLSQIRLISKDGKQSWDVKVNV
jgi:hypothetical protein